MGHAITYHEERTIPVTMPWAFFDQWSPHILDHLVHTMNAKYKAGHLHRCLCSVDGSFRGQLLRYV